MKPKELMKVIETGTKKHAPTILTGLGVAGMIATVATAIKVTPKAYLLVKNAEKEKDEKLTAIEVVKTTWKCYIPVAASGAASIFCVITANKINTKRNAALNAACALAMSSLKEYSEKVVETVGEKKEEQIRNEIAKDKVEKYPVSKSKVFETGKGDTLCFDALSGRYFKSDINELKRAMNDMNYVMLNETGVSLNEIYYSIGLDGIKLGEGLGWSIDRGMVEMWLSTQLSDDGRPCVVMDFKPQPYYPF